jgi:TatD DNase family protein
MTRHNVLIDSHAHLTTQELVDGELERAHDAAISAIINICTDASSLEKGLLLASRSTLPRIYNVASTTPHDVEKDGHHFFPMVEKAARANKLVAIGETGLDYYYQYAPRDVQIYFLSQYLQLAQQTDLPVVIHCRDAFQDFYTLFDEEARRKKEPLRTVLHCFTGTLEEAREGLDRGLFFSFSGIITFPKSEALREVVRSVPLNRLLIETDSPYLAPMPFRGKKNESAYLVETAKMVAMLKGISFEELARATSENATNFFRLHV